jgi:hypothetical protein
MLSSDVCDIDDNSSIGEQEINEEMVLMVMRGR